MPEVSAQENPKAVVDSPENPEKKKFTLKELVIDFCDPSHIIDAFSVFKRLREGNGRKMLFFVILCNTFFFATIGEEGLYILFFRTQLNWTIEFSFYITYFTATSLVGTGISTLIFAKLMKISDPVLGIISTIGTFISNLILVSLSL